MSVCIFVTFYERPFYFNLVLDGVLEWPMQDAELPLNPAADFGKVQNMQYYVTYDLFKSHFVSSGLLLRHVLCICCFQLLHTDV